jgi:hypothetical protein
MSSAPVGTARDLLQLLGETPCEVLPPRADADEREIVHRAVSFGDLVRNARQRAAHAVRVHHHGHGECSRRVIRMRGSRRGSMIRFRAERGRRTVRCDPDHEQEYAGGR